VVESALNRFSRFFWSAWFFCLVTIVLGFFVLYALQRVIQVANEHNAGAEVVVSFVVATSTSAGLWPMVVRPAPPSPGAERAPRHGGAGFVIVAELVAALSALVQIGPAWLQGVGCGVLVAFGVLYFVRSIRQRAWRPPDERPGAQRPAPGEREAPQSGEPRG
jgi:hypothetical protein